MAQNAVNQAGANGRLGSYCVTATINDSSCHADHCHNTTTHVHNCDDYYEHPDCANSTTHIDICNSTICRNTTRHIHVCIHDISNPCVSIDIKIDSCTDGACRNRTSAIHLCLNSFNVASAAVCAAEGDNDPADIRAASVTSCIDGLRTFFGRVLGK